MRMRSLSSLAAATCLVLLAAACSSTPSASEYGADLEGIARSVDAKMDAEWEQFFAMPPSIDATRAFLDLRVARYTEAIEDFDALDPPPQLEEMHAAIVDFLNALLTVERDRAAFAGTIESVDDLEQVWMGPATAAVEAVEIKSVALCQAVQAEFDETHERADLANVPWIPPELKETVSIVLNCPDVFTPAFE